MDKIACLPYAAIQFTKDGRIHDEQEVQHLRDQLRGGVTDLIVMSHGWNNDMKDAENLYQRFFAEVCSKLGDPATQDRRFAVLGVLWPSKRFTDPEQIPGGAAALSRGLDDEALAQARELLDGMIEPDDLEEALALLERIEDSPQAQRDLTALLQGYLAQAEIDPEEAPAGLLEHDGAEVFRELEKPLRLRGERIPERVAGEGEAAGLFTGSLGGAAMNLLNVFTYYTMRHRSGVVGCEGLNPLLNDAMDEHPELRLHLVGHSFGARLVTAAVSGCGNPLHVASMTLLQAAFSHYAFAEKFDGQRDGHFRNVVASGLVAGPLVVTHTRNDRAVGIAYALASRLAGQVAMAIGGRSDRYGGLGSNGAHPEKTPEAIDLELTRDGQFSFEQGKVYNLRSDDVIRGHSDIVHPETAAVVLAAAGQGVS